MTLDTSTLMRGRHDDKDRHNTGFVVHNFLQVFCSAVQEKRGPNRKLNDVSISLDVVDELKIDPLEQANIVYPIERLGNCTIGSIAISGIDATLAQQLETHVLSGARQFDYVAACRETIPSMRRLIKFEQQLMGNAYMNNVYQNPLRLLSNYERIVVGGIPNLYGMEYRYLGPTDEVVLSRIISDMRLCLSWVDLDALEQQVENETQARDIFQREHGLLYTIPIHVPLAARGHPVLRRGFIGLLPVG
ncbi:hypothetical protein M8818_004539 [Zalaria obscura]|uniref:Uncharacterized protein n=1 Tax=Zalaria obscura TaxID=2024903 RepID=A0ACC3SBT0_9PEZI